MMHTTPLDNSYMRVRDGAEFLQWSVGELLADAVRCEPDRLALVVPASIDGRSERRWTYTALQEESERAAKALLHHFNPGDRVATLAAASAEVLFLQLGAALAGITLVTLNPASRPTELEYLLASSGSRGIFMDREYRKVDNAAALSALKPALPRLQTTVFLDRWSDFIATAVQGALPAVSADEPVLILFTSGTTGKPKGVVLRHSGIVNNARFTTERIGLEFGSVWLNVLPMFHVGGSVTMTLGCFANRGTHVLLPEFNAEAMLDAIDRYQVTMTMAVPTMLYALLRSERFAATKLNSLQAIVTGATAIAPELVREVKQRFAVDVMVLFGQTEAGGCMCLTRRGDSEDRVTQSVGTPLPLSEAKIIAAQSPDAASRAEPLPIGDVGEICVRSRCVMIEYFGNAAQTRETLDSDGWVHTGDLGMMRADGYIQIKGRLKDMIIRGGENIYPREIEDVLVAHPAIAQAAVFAVPDVKWGEQVAAAVILKSGQTVDTQQLVGYLQEHIARHKIPKIWQIVANFPLNASGKVQKFLLQAQYLANQNNAAGSP